MLTVFWVLLADWHSLSIADPGEIVHLESNSDFFSVNTWQLNNFQNSKDKKVSFNLKTIKNLFFLNKLYKKMAKFVIKSVFFDQDVQ